MRFDHTQPGAPGDHAKLIGVRALRLEDRGDAILQCGAARRRTPTSNDHGASATIQRCQNQTRYSTADRHRNPNPARLSQHDRQRDQRRAEQPQPQALRGPAGAKNRNDNSMINANISSAE